MKTTFTFAEIEVCGVLGKKIINHFDIPVVGDDVINELRKKASVDPTITVDDVNQEVTFKLPDGMFIEVAEVIVKYSDSLLPLASSLAQVAKVMFGIFKDMGKDLSNVFSKY